MPEPAKQEFSSGLSKPLTERERQSSQRAFIVMACLMVVANRIMGTDGPLGAYLKNLQISPEQLGKLVAITTPFSILGLLFARWLGKVGMKKMMTWALIPLGLFSGGLLVLPFVKARLDIEAILLVAIIFQACCTASNSILNVPWFPMIQTISLPERRSIFLGRMRLAWALATIVVPLVIARIMGEKAEPPVLMPIIGLAAGLYWLMCWPLQRVVEHRRTATYTPISWAEAWQEIRANPLYVRIVSVEAVCWFGLSIFTVFQFYFLTYSLDWSDSAAVDIVWVGLVGLAISNLFWGMVEDRMGARSVAQVGFVGLAAAALCWVVAGNAGQFAKAMIVLGALGCGVFRAATQMNLSRVILNRIPERVSPVLLTIRNVMVTLTTSAAAGAGALIIGWLKDWHWTCLVNWLILDAYKLLFLMAAVLWLGMVWVCRRLPGAADRTPWTVLASMFNRPLHTATMISQIESSLPEDGRLNLVHRLSQSSSPLAHEALLAGLSDASYDVRLASVNALAARGDPQSVNALIKVLEQGELDIQPEAAWALGEAGDIQAAPALTAALGASSEILRGRAARALGKLQARPAVLALQRMLASDSDSFARRSAALALARLNARESLAAIFEQFRLAETRLGQRELALALANLVHGGDLYYRIRRHDIQGLAAVLEEAVDESLAEKAVNGRLRECFAEMISALSREDLSQVRKMALRAIEQNLLRRPSGDAGELTEYLLASEPVEPWAEEHAALLVFLLLQELTER